MEIEMATLQVMIDMIEHRLMRNDCIDRYKILNCIGDSSYRIDKLIFIQKNWPTCDALPYAMVDKEFQG